MRQCIKIGVPIKDKQGPDTRSAVYQGRVWLRQDRVRLNVLT